MLIESTKNDIPHIVCQKSEAELRGMDPPANERYPGASSGVSFVLQGIGFYAGPYPYAEKEDYAVNCGVRTRLRIKANRTSTDREIV